MCPTVIMLVAFILASQHIFGGWDGSAVAVNQNRLLNCLSHTCGKELKVFYRLFSITLWLYIYKIPCFLDNAATVLLIFSEENAQKFMTSGLCTFGTFFSRYPTRPESSDQTQRVGLWSNMFVSTTTFILKGFHTHRHLQWDSNYWSLFKCCCVTVWCYFLNISTVAGCMQIL